MSIVPPHNHQHSPYPRPSGEPDAPKGRSNAFERLLGEEVAATLEGPVPKGFSQGSPPDWREVGRFNENGFFIDDRSAPASNRNLPRQQLETAQPGQATPRSGMAEIAPPDAQARSADEVGFDHSGHAEEDSSKAGLHSNTECVASLTAGPSGGMAAPANGAAYAFDLSTTASSEAVAGKTAPTIAGGSARQQISLRIAGQSVLVGGQVAGLGADELASLARAIERMLASEGFFEGRILLNGREFRVHRRKDN